MNRRNLGGPLALLCALASACSSETVAMWPAAPVHWQHDPDPVLVSSPVTPTEEERGLADVYTAALASPNFAELDSILDDQVQLAFGVRNTHGRERVIKGHEEMFGAFDQRNFVTNRLWLTDSTHPVNSQAIEWTMTGVQARDWMGVAATLKPVVIKGLTLLWTTDDGIISDLRVYFDEDVIKAQLGSGPADLRKLPFPSPTAGPRQGFERSGTPEEASNVATVRLMIQSLEDDKETDFLSTMADDVQVFTLDSIGAIRGKDAARTHFRTLRKSIRLLDTVIQNAWGVQSFVILEYAITGLQQAPIRRIAFSANHPIHTQFVDIAEMDKGKIARIWRYADPAAFGVSMTASTITRPDAAAKLGANRLKGLGR
jgi:ketosteroid isomerase-like protein